MVQSGEYGQFFPAVASPFYYNESSAQMFYPLSKEEALQRGYRWHDSTEEELGDNSPVPDGIPVDHDRLLDQVYSCSATGKGFRFVRPELKFYQAHGIPLPDQAPMERIRRKLGFYNIAPLSDLACCACGDLMRTVYAGGSQRVLCEKCYQVEVY